MNEEAKNSGGYTIADIKKYLAGALSPAEMHAMEKAALDDPFLADAMEGMQSLQNSGNTSFDQDIAALRQRLKNQTAGKGRAVIFFSNTRWWQVAAVVLVIVAIGVTFPYLFKQAEKPAVIAAKKESADSIRILHEDEASATASDTMSEVASAKDRATTAPAAPEDLYRNQTLHKKNRRDTNSRADAIQAIAGTSPSGDQSKAGNKSQPRPAAVAKQIEKDTGEPKAFVTTENEVKNIDSIKNKDIAQLADKRLQGTAPGVVVEGYASRSRKAFGKEEPQNAEPVMGWTAFRKYLEENRKLPKDSLKAEVLVSFRVSKKGKISNFNIEKSLGPDYDAEAIRLIKEGPAWRTLKGKKTRATVAVEF